MVDNGKTWGFAQPVLSPSVGTINMAMPLLVVDVVQCCFFMNLLPVPELLYNHLPPLHLNIEVYFR